MKSAGDMEDLKYDSTSGKLPPRGMFGFGRKAALAPSALLRWRRASKRGFANCWPFARRGGQVQLMGAGAPPSFAFPLKA